MSSDYVTLIVTLISWLGIFLYLLRLDKKIKEMDRK